MLNTALHSSSKQTFLESDFRVFLAGVFLLAALPRLALVLLIGDAPLKLDEIEYDRIAWNLSSGLGFTWFFDLPTTFRPPGYPAFLAVIYSVFGPDYSIGRAFGAVVAAMAAPLTAILGAQTLGQKVGRIASIVVALYLPLIIYAAALMSENVFGTLLLLVLILLIEMVRSPLLSRAAPAGIVFGVATLTTSAFAAFPAFLVCFALLRAKQHPGLWARIAVFVVTALLVIVPWSVRNYLVTDRIMFIDSRLGINLHIGFNADADGKVSNPDDLLSEAQQIQGGMIMPDVSYRSFMDHLLADRFAYRDRQRLDAPIPEAIREQGPVLDLVTDDLGKQRAKAYITEHPVHSALLSVPKFAGFWDMEHRLYIFAYTNNMFGEIPRPALAILFVLLLAPFPVLLLLAVADQCATRHFSSERLMMLLPIAYFSAIHSVIFGDARFHFVIIPFIAVFAAHCWVNRRSTAGLLWRDSAAAVQGLALRRGLFATGCALFVAIWIWGQIQTMDTWAIVFSQGAHQSYLRF